MQVNLGKQGGVIRFDSSDWVAGLIPQWSANSGIANRVIAGGGLSFARGIDPFRNYGYLTPGTMPTDATNNSVIDAVQLAAVTNGNKAYTIGGTKLHEFTITTDTITNAGDFPHTISAHSGHSSVAGSDVVTCYIGSTKYLFYSWNDDTDGDVGRYDLSTTFDDDWMSTIPASGAVQSTTNPHPMIVGDDGFLYIGDGNVVNSLDGQTGANGTYEASSLDLPVGYVITSFAKVENYLVIFAYRSELSGSSYYKAEATAFFWDMISPTFTYSYDLKGNYVNGGFNWKNTVGCFTQGSSPYIYENKLSSLLIFDGSKFEPVRSFTDNIPGHGGVEVIDDVIYGNCGGVVYQYGNPHPTEDSSFNRITEFGGTTSGGFLANFAGSSLYGSAGTTSSGGFEKMSGGYYSNALFRTPTANLPFGSDMKGRIKKVKVFWGQVTEADCNTFSLSVVTDRGNTTTTVLSNLGSVAATDLVTSYTTDSSGAGFPEFASLNIIGSYTGGVDNTKIPPYIQAVEIYFDNVTTLNK